MYCYIYYNIKKKCITQQKYSNIYKYVIISSGNTFCTINMYLTIRLTFSHPEALPGRVKSYSVRQSKLTKGTVLAGLGEKGFKREMGRLKYT